MKHIFYVCGAVFLIALFACNLSPETNKKDNKAKEKPTSVELTKYTLVKGEIPVENIRDNSSGMTYNWDTKTLFIVIDSPRRIVECDKEGKFKRIITLNKFSDPEGIAYLGDGKFAVLEERRCKASVVTITDKTDHINYSDVKQTLIEKERVGNKGLEGITYDPVNKMVYVIKEKRPRKIYKFPREELGKEEAKVTHPWDAKKDSLNLADFSDLFYHKETGHLLMLSHESFCLIECTLDGKKVSELSLREGAAGLKTTIPKAEGIVMDENGTIFICSEGRTPLYVYKKKK